MHIAVGRFAQFLFGRRSASTLELQGEELILGRRSDTTRIRLQELTDFPRAKDGLFWARLEIPTQHGIIVVAGLPKRKTAEFAGAVSSAAEPCLLRACEPDLRRWREALAELDTMAAGSYVRASRFQAWRPAEPWAENPVLQSALDRKHADLARRIRDVLRDPEEERKRLNARFVERALANHAGFFERVEQSPLTERQREACVVDEDNNLVLAGAGSGKTSVIIGKAGYLVRSGQAKPEEILILAFGRKAARETDERIRKRLSGMSIRSSTFHALGLSLLGEAGGRKPTLSNLAEDPEEKEKFILETVLELAKSTGLGLAFSKWLSTCPVPRPDPFECDSEGAYYKQLFEHDNRTIDGERLKSHEEVCIANFLTLNGVRYRYEAPYKRDVSDRHHAQYRPDFHLPDYDDVYIEHFAVDERNRTPPFIDQARYVAGIDWKRDVHRRYGTRLIETYSYEQRQGALTDRLRQRLELMGMRLAPRPVEEIIKRAREKKEDLGIVGRLLKLLGDFLQIFKTAGFTLEDLRAKAASRPDRLRATLFLDLFSPVYTQYESRLKQNAEVDFNDMIVHATRLVRSGRYRSPYSHILVDEFQDISAARAELLKALIASRPGSSLFCVGDDWQSIYRFTGSDIGLSKDFNTHFGPVAVTKLDLTFRFNQQICSFASKFILKNRDQIEKEVGSRTHADGPAITIVHHTGSHQDALEFCFTEIAERAGNGGSVYVLGRYGHLVYGVRDRFGRRRSQLKMLYDTVHSSKGKEADYVVVLDLNRERYGFPSEIGDDPLMELVLPARDTFPHAEERRLFYVAVTRARHHVYLVTNSEKPSAFIEEIRAAKGRDYSFREVHADEHAKRSVEPVACPKCVAGRLVLRMNQDGRGFYGCNLYRLCKYTFDPCEACGGAPRLDRGVYRCSICSLEVSQACPRCKFGRLIEKNGKRGPFLGCSNWAKTRCDYSRDI